jgi:hypothetical protein
MSDSGSELDRSGEFGERCGDSPLRCGVVSEFVVSEFVVSASQVLYEGMSGDDHLRGPVGP